MQGRVDKIANTKALLEQAYIKDSGRTVGEVIKEAVAAIGENIQIRRFQRFNLGETVAKRGEWWWWWWGRGRGPSGAVAKRRERWWWW